MSDAKKLSILFKQVYIKTYGVEGVSDEFANYIVKKFAVEKIENNIKENSDGIIVASYKGNLVGVAELEFSKTCPVENIIGPELIKLYILDWFGGKGIGHQLLERIEDIIRSKGENQMWLWVLETNERAIKFYQKEKFNSIGNASFQMVTNKYENKIMLKKL